MKIKRLTKKSLAELNLTLSGLDEASQRECIGGGDGSINSPWTLSEYQSQYGYFQGGYVDFGENGVLYVGSDSYYGTEYNQEYAISYITAHACSSSTGLCAGMVRCALEAGGLNTDGRPGSACDYDTWLQSRNFIVVGTKQSGTLENYVPQEGDIVVFESTTGHSHGHIAMFCGSGWYSDFKQNSMFVSSAYQQEDVEYTILRFNN